MKAYIEFMDVNGLEKGLIPAGKPCPFIEGCQFLADTCPSSTLTIIEAHDCVVARLKSFAKTIRDAEHSPDETFFTERES